MKSCLVSCQAQCPLCASCYVSGWQPALHVQHISFLSGVSLRVGAHSRPPGLLSAPSTPDSSSFRERVLLPKQPPCVQIPYCQKASWCTARANVGAGGLLLHKLGFHLKLLPSNESFLDINVKADPTGSYYNVRLDFSALASFPPHFLIISNWGDFFFIFKDFTMSLLRQALWGLIKVYIVTPELLVLGHCAQCSLSHSPLFRGRGALAGAHWPCW